MKIVIFARFGRRSLEEGGDVDLSRFRLSSKDIACGLVSFLPASVGMSLWSFIGRTPYSYTSVNRDPGLNLGVPV